MSGFKEDKRENGNWVLEAALSLRLRNMGWWGEGGGFKGYRKQGLGACLCSRGGVGGIKADSQIPHTEVTQGDQQV